MLETGNLSKLTIFFDIFLEETSILNLMKEK